VPPFVGEARKLFGELDTPYKRLRVRGDIFGDLGEGERLGDRFEGDRLFERRCVECRDEPSGE